jgi:hypothetical protein
MLAYCLWRVRNGHHHTITLNFMIAGHTKFAVDWGFGLIKKRFRQTRWGASWLFMCSGYFSFSCLFSDVTP